MIFPKTFLSGLTALALTQYPGSASTVLQQLPFAVGDTNTAKDAPGCQDTFNGTIHIPTNSTTEEDRLPVFHFNGRLYAAKNKNPSQWTVKKLDNGRYHLYSLHPSGTKHYWSYSYDNAISITADEYSANQFQFAQIEETEEPFTNFTIFQDDRCLVVPYNPESSPLQMLQLSACDTVIFNFTEPLQWKYRDDLCKKD